jgi:hypothetical protein
MEHEEYLLSYGLRGAFGRFRATETLGLERGDRVVVRSPRGIEAATVLCPARPRHAHFLPNTTLSPLLRRLAPADEAALERSQQRGLELLQSAAELAARLELPLELLDAEVLLDSEHAVLHHLRWADADLRPFVSSLSRQFAVRLTLEDLTRPQPEEHGCGHCGEGGCGSCGAGGCGSCGSASSKELAAYFAGLRTQMERQRVPLV